MTPINSEEKNYSYNIPPNEEKLINTSQPTKVLLKIFSYFNSNNSISTNEKKNYSYNTPPTHEELINTVLPVEVLLRIFSYFNSNDLISTSLVSHSWSCLYRETKKHIQFSLIKNYIESLNSKSLGSAPKEITKKLITNNRFQIEIAVEIATLIKDHKPFTRSFDKTFFLYLNGIKSDHFITRSFTCSFKGELLKEISKALTERGRFEKSLQVANYIEGATVAKTKIIGKKIKQKFISVSTKNKALRRISIALAKKGKVTEAIKVADMIDDFSKNKAFIVISEALAKKGEFARAKEFVNKIDDDYQKFLALSGISTSILNDIQIGNIELPTSVVSDNVKVAEEFINMIVYEHKRLLLFRIFAVFEWISINFAIEGEFNKAIEFATKIKDASMKDSALDQISDVLVENDNFEMAKEFANLIVNKTIKHNALQKISKASSKKAKKPNDCAIS